MDFTKGKYLRLVLVELGPRLVFATFIASMLLLMVSCDQNQEKPKSKKDAAEVDDSDAVPDEVDPDSDTEESTDTDGGDDFVDDDTPDEGPQTLDELLEQCGGKGVSDAKPEDVVYKNQIKSVAVIKDLGVITIDAQTTLDILVTGAESKQTSTVNVETEAVLPFILDLAKGQIDAIRDGNSGATTFTNIPFEKYSSLGTDYQAWDGTLCTFIPASKVVNEKGGFKTVVEFDPPLPASVSPRADPSRYTAEIGDDRIFEEIKATIKESDNSVLEGTKEIIGKVTVMRVDTDTTYTLEGMKETPIKADAAFRVTYDFGTPEETFAIGLPPEVTYYISHSKKDLIANVVDTKNTTTGKVIFLFPDKPITDAEPATPDEEQAE